VWHLTANRILVQVKKEQEELDRAFGRGQKLKLPGKIAMMASKAKGDEPEMATILVYGDAERAATAQRMLLECVDNKEQKQKQRQKVRLFGRTMPRAARACVH
jgi:hypothetical protein